MSHFRALLDELDDIFIAADGSVGNALDLNTFGFVFLNS